MEKLSTSLVNNYKRHLLGRMKLKFFQKLTGAENSYPSNNQVIEYIENIENKDYSIALMRLLLLEDIGETDYQKLIELYNLDLVIAYLEKNPLPNPIFIEIFGCKERNLPETIGVYIDCYKNSNNETCYSVLLFSEENFFEGVHLYSVIRLSTQTPEPFIIVFSENKPIEYTRKNYLNSEINLFLVKILNYLYNKPNPINYITFDEMILYNKEITFTAPKAPKDKRFDKLIINSGKGLIHCIKAITDIENIQPFDIDFCLNYPKDLISDWMDKIEEKKKMGLLVYWDGQNFITSDDYCYYLALKTLSEQKILIICLGQFPPNKAKVIEIGRSELIPGAFNTSDKNNYQDLSRSEKEEKLSQELQIFKITRNLEKFKRTYKAIILTEDKNFNLLKIILESSGFKKDEFEILSYEGCTNILSIKLLIEFLNKRELDHKIIVHRDRDYLSNEKINKIINEIEKLNAKLFLTKGTDLESYFVNIEHINALYQKLTKSQIQKLISDSIKEIENTSLSYMKKSYEFVNLGEENLDEIIIKQYNSNQNIYFHGKTVLRAIKAKLQKLLRKNSNLLQKTDYLMDENLKTMAKNIWKM
ncbi:MAG: hypothetical protein AABZ74_17130 [Cyanobacteriota bacterium]